MKTLITIILFSFASIITNAQSVDSTSTVRCTAISYSTGTRCNRTVHINPPMEIDVNDTEVYCWQHSKIHVMWRDCITTSDYTDASLAICDALYGNVSFDMRVPAIVVIDGKIKAFDPEK